MKDITSTKSTTISPKSAESTTVISPEDTNPEEPVRWWRNDVNFYVAAMTMQYINRTNISISDGEDVEQTSLGML